MKDIFIVVLLFVFSKVGFSQNGTPLPPTKQSLGNTQTTEVTTYNMVVRGAFVLGHFVDTTAANAIPYVKNYANGLITTDTNLLWIRSYNAKRWYFVPNTGNPASSDTLYWRIGGNDFSTMVGENVLATKNNVELNIGTNNQKRLVIRADGINRSGAGINKCLTFDTATLELYYTDCGSGGGSAALTKTDDTNVTLTLGGTPSTALLQATSLNLGWTGTLADGRIASAANWNTAYTNRITGLTTTGSSGASTLIANTLNVPNYTLAGLGLTFGTDNQIPFVNAGGAGFDYSGNLIFDGTTQSISGSTTTSTLRIGTLETQSFSLGNSWISDNTYFDGTNWRNRAAGAGTLFYFYGAEGQFRTYPSQGGAGANITSYMNYAQMKVMYANRTVAIGGDISQNTGILTGASLIASSTGVIINEDGGNLDTRIEGDTDPNLIFVDASTDRVGIGTVTPAAKLDVVGGDILIQGLTFGKSNSSSLSSIAIGDSAFYDATTAGGIAIGRLSQRKQLSGTNISIGNSSMDSSITGSSNVAIGSVTLRNGGTHAVAIGTFSQRSSVYNSSSYSGSTSVGTISLFSQTTGKWNTAFGTAAGYGITTGENNLAIGKLAMGVGEPTVFGGTVGITGNNKTALGVASLYNSKTGNGDVGIGYGALFNSNPVNGANVAIGYNSGSSITSGSYNVVIGGNSGSTIATASNHIIISDGQGNARINIDSAGNGDLVGTGGLKLNVGTTAQRPTAAFGIIRANSDSSKLEWYDGVGWTLLGSGGAGGGSGDMVLASAQTNSGAKTFLDGTFLLRNVANTFTGQFTNTNTANRTYTLPDRALTIDNITTSTTSTGTGFVKANGSVISFDNSTYLTAEVDGSTSNELQTLASTSDATSHTITLSNSGGSFKIAEGTGITITTSGTGLDGVATIAATATGTVTNFVFTDGGGFDGTVATSTTTPTLSLLTTVANKSVIYSASGALTASMATQETDQFLITGTTTSVVPFVVNAIEAQTADITKLQVAAVDVFGFNANGNITMLESGTFTTPAAGYGKIYFKTDGLVYGKDDAGLETKLSNDGSGGMADPGGNGVVVRTALNVTTNRTLTGTANRLTISNGDGVAGNPTFDVTSTSAATASRIMERDANANVRANNFIQNITTTATAGATTTLLVGSSEIQTFTGTLTQNCDLPDATTLVNGHEFTVHNNSTGAVTVRSNGGATLNIIAASSDMDMILTDNGTAAGVWDTEYRAGNSASGKISTFNNSITYAGTDGTTMTFPTTSATIARTDALQTFTGVQTFSSAPVLSTGTVTVSGNAVTFPTSVSTLAILGANTFTGAQTFTSAAPQLTLGVNTTTIGSIKMFGNTSGDVTLQPTAVAGTATVQTLPATTGTLVNRVTSSAGVSASNSDGALTFTLGAITPTTVNGHTFTAGSSTFTGTAAAVYTFPAATKTIAANDGSNWTIASQATGDILTATSATAYGRVAAVATGQVLISQGTSTAPIYSVSPTVSNLLTTNNAITAAANAATVPVTSAISTVTNNSAATLTITITTASAIDGQMLTVRVLDFSGVAQTITWVNTENSSIAAPTTSNGSTTLFATIRFVYNSATTKWRCIGYA